MDTTFAGIAIRTVEQTLSTRMGMLGSNRESAFSEGLTCLANYLWSIQRSRLAHESAGISL